MGLKVNKEVFRNFLILIIPILILLLSFKLIALNPIVYNTEMDKLGNQEYDSQVTNLLDYLNNKNSLVGSYNTIEKMHLYDVKELLDKSDIVLYFTSIISILLILFLYYNKTGLESFYYGGLLTLSLLLITFVAIQLSFVTSFTYFHKLLFTNNYWVLNDNDLLIKMFPETFFHDLAQYIFGLVLLFSLFLTTAGYFIKKRLN